MPDAAPGFKRLLMLQGPVGPFFWLLARRLRRQGVAVHKVNLNFAHFIELIYQE